MGPLGRGAGWLDDRTGLAKPARALMKKVFPDHWSFMLGEIAMYSLVVLLLTGTFLTFWFVPSAGRVVYDGSYVPLKGLVVSEAYRSTVDISFDIRGGLVIRQIHHWAALLFICSIMVHMCRVFFTGAFRKPRELNWVIGTLLSLLAVAEGFAGYSLPDDLLSGTGLRIAEGLMQSVPVIGSWLAFAVFDGPFPGDAIIPRLFTVHVLLLPALIVGLFAAHIILVVVQKHTQYPGPGHTNANVVGFRLMPVYLAKAGGFFFMVFGTTALIAALVTINPIWMYGPYEPSAATAGSQPDWYMGFAEGALRLMPSWEFTALGHTLSLNVLVPGVLLIPVLYGIAMVYPFLERWVIGDQGEQHVLDRPRDAATRTGLGAMALTFYLVLFIAGADDIIADRLHLSFEDLVVTFRVLLLVAPPAAFWVAKRACLGLQRRDRELVLHGRETGRLVRQGHGRFFEAHEPLDRYQRWPLVSRAARPPGDGTRTPDQLHPATFRSRIRGRLARFYLGDPIDPPTPAEVGRSGEESLPVPLSRSDPRWDGAVHGGADERPVTDAYARYGRQHGAGEDADAGRQAERVNGGRRR